MYKVLLVDDEKQIRQGLKAKLNWQEHGFICCGEAADGREALAMIEAEQPHVVITDIRMPNMDGVALLEHCREHFPHVRIVVLSGYEDFHYVKAAMRCGAKDYLLKPVIRKELASRLANIRDELDAGMKQQLEGEHLKRRLHESLDRLREQFWLQAVRGATGNDRAAEAERLGLGTFTEAPVPLRFVTFGVLNLRQQPPLPVQDELLLQAVYMMSSELAATWGEPAHVFRDPAAAHHLHMVFQCAAFGEAAHDAWLQQQFCPTMESLLRVRVQMGIGDTVYTQEEWRQSFVTSRIRWMETAHAPSGDRHMNSEAATSQTTTAQYELPPYIQKQLAGSVAEGNEQDIVRVLRSVLQTTPPLSLHALSLRSLRLLLFFDSLALKHGQLCQETQVMINALPDSIWQCQTPEEAERTFLQLAVALHKQMREEERTDGESIARRVVEYLHDHYADEDISLTGMARRFHLHVTYLSELFKKTTGKNYSEYLTDIRIAKAKEWMDNTTLKVAEIAELAGFSNPNYFSQVFKKMTGMSPNEYRTRKK